MEQISFVNNEITAARLTVPFTQLGRLGPKHHAIIIGANAADGEIWIAELSRRHGYRLVALRTWLEDNRPWLRGLRIQLNEGPRLGADIARSAIDEVIAETKNDGRAKYHVLFNNCETFADRHSGGSVEPSPGTVQLSPQVRMTARMISVALAGGAVILRRQLLRF